MQSMTGTSDGWEPVKQPQPPSDGRFFRMTHLESGKVLERVPEDVVGAGAPAWYSRRGWTVEVIS